MIGQNDIMGALAAYNLPQLDRTIQQLMSVDPVLQQGYLDLLVQMSQAGLQPVAVEGFRDPARQDALFDQGGVTNARGGQSYHNYGQALDIVPGDLLGDPNWAPNSPLWTQMGDIVRDAGFTWGGDFSSIFDPAHVQAPGELGVSEPVMTAAPPAAVPEVPMQDLASAFLPGQQSAAPFEQAPVQPDPLAQIFLASALSQPRPQPVRDDPERRRQLASLMVPNFV